MHFQPHKDKYEIFSAIRPQLQARRKGFLYGPHHMCLHLLDYMKENYGELETELKKPLEVHRQSLQNYLEMMEWTPSLGSEITLLIICRMFKISILVVCADFIWVSENIAPFNADVVLVQNCNGHFLGMKRIESKLVDIGEVPQYIVNKHKSPSMKTSTSKEKRNGKEPVAELIDPGLLPIVKQENQQSKDDTGFSMSETTSSTRRLHQEVIQFEETTMEEKDDSIGEEDEKKRSPKHVQKLNIKDIRNDTSSDVTQNIDEAGKEIILTLDSSQPINMTTEEDDVSTGDRKSFDAIKVSENLATTRDVKSDSIMTEGNSDVSRTITPDDDDLMSLNETNQSHFEKKEEIEDKQDKYDPDETIDCGEDDKQSEISDNDDSTADNAKKEDGDKSEISDIKLKKAIKRLGLNGPVVVLKPLPKQDEYIAQAMENEENVKYKSISAVKLGCNRCTEVFYSEGGYNNHLFRKHRVRNVLRNPPTVINRLWS